MSSTSSPSYSSSSRDSSTTVSNQNSTHSLPSEPSPSSSSSPPPYALSPPKLNSILSSLFSPSHSPILFFDYDGTLTNIVNSPSDAIISDEMKRELSVISSLFPTYIVTGRKYLSICSLLRIPPHSSSSSSTHSPSPSPSVLSLGFATSHGFEVRDMKGNVVKKVSEDKIKLISQFENHLNEKLNGMKGEEKDQINGYQIENNEYSLSIHYRQIQNPEGKEKIKQIISSILSSSVEYSDNLLIFGGKEVVEIRAKKEWNKGTAIQFIMEEREKEREEKKNSSSPSPSPSLISLFIGDDLTDEDGFAALSNEKHSITILVHKYREKENENDLTIHHRKTKAKYYVNSVCDVQILLNAIGKRAEEGEGEGEKKQKTKI